MKKVMLAALAVLAVAGQADAGHYAAVGAGSCGYCHKTNLVTQHGGFVANVCGTCHNSTATAVVTTIAAGTSGQPYSCGSCHTTTSHAALHGTYIANFQTLRGVQPAATAIWTQPAAYTAVTPAAKEYQACYVCHSSYAFGATTNGVTGIVGPGGDNLTDQAMEFNPANRSAHPVQAAANAFTGSPAPKALLKTQLTAAWQMAGTQTMKCGDCHSAGSTEKFMLIAGTTWPRKADGKFWALGDLNSSTSGWQTKLFCVKCHPMKSGSGSWFNSVHGEGDHQDSYRIAGESTAGAPCVSCHVAVPHGAKRSRLIGYVTDARPFAAYGSNGTTMSTLKGFRKASTPNGYSENNCWSTVSACSDHSSASGTYEP